MTPKSLPEAPTSSLQTAPASAIHFGSFSLDLVGGQLLSEGTPVPLRPKTWAVLLYMAERPGVLITRDDLLDAIWPEIAVTPDTINKSVGELRAALRDRKDAPRYIETVHGRGFRFIAPTRQAGLAAAASRAAVASARTELARPFVGRDEQIESLAHLLDRAHRGERQMVFITGPAGIGKTALIEAFAESPAIVRSPMPVWIARGSCIQQHGPREPYLPVLNAVERLARRADGDRLVELLHRVAPMWLAQMPWLMSEADAQALRVSLQGISSERMLREMAVLIEALTEDLALVLVLEDLHWSDPATVDLLSLLGQRDDPARLLVIGTYRPADVAVEEHPLGTAVRGLRVHRQCGDLPLHDLDERAVCDYLSKCFPGADFARALAHVIHAHTGGQPLFVAAVVDHMLSRGWILDTDPGWALSVPLESIELGVPEDVRRMIEMQIERASPAGRHLLQAASAAGEPIVPALVAAALECDVAEAELRCEDNARHDQFLCAAGSEVWADGMMTRRYAFTHELRRQVVYESIPDFRRSRLHRRIGLALEVAYAERVADVAPKLAFHFERAGDAARSLHYLTIAGKRARRRFADREAIGYFEAALAAAAHIRDEAERGRKELGVRLILGRALSDTFGYAAPEVRANYELALELARALGDDEQLFDCLYACWYLHGSAANARETNAMLARMEEIARRPGIGMPLVLLHSAQIRTALWQGRFADTAAPMKSLLARSRRQGVGTQDALYGPDPVTAAALHHAIALWFLGDVAGAFSTAPAFVARARESQDPLFLCSALTLSAILHLLDRRIEPGFELAEEVVRLSGERGFAFWKGSGMAMRGWARVQREEYGAGCGELEEGIGVLQGAGARFFLTYAHGFLADSYLRAGAVGKGIAAVDAAFAFGESGFDGGYTPELWRLKGELLLAGAALRTRSGRRDADRAAGEQCLLRARAMARASGARSLELRASTSIARLWRSGPRAAQASAWLRASSAWFEKRPKTADLAAARALLSSAPARRGARGA